MGKHSGKADTNDTQGPHGTGPFPTPEESAKKAAEFDALFAANKAAAEAKRGEK